MENLSGKISDSELEVMRVLWEAGDALPVTEIRQTLQERKGWEATTVKTLVQRLVTVPWCPNRNTTTGPPTTWYAACSGAAPRSWWPRWSSPRA